MNVFRVYFNGDPVARVIATDWGEARRLAHRLYPMSRELVSIGFEMMLSNLDRRQLLLRSKSAKSGGRS